MTLVSTLFSPLNFNIQMPFLHGVLKEKSHTILRVANVLRVRNILHKMLSRGHDIKMRKSCQKSQRDDFQPPRLERVFSPRGIDNDVLFM